MLDRLLIAIIVLTHTLVALAFVVTDGPADSPVVLELTSAHGVHSSDVPIIVLWLVGVCACGALAWRRRPT